MLENAPEGQGLPYLCAKDVHMYNIDFSSLKKMHFSKKEKERYEIKRGDMLVVEGGAAGSSAIVKSDVKDVYIQNSIMITRCNNSKMINDYACYVLNSMILRGYSESICNKATIMHFTKEKLGDTIITAPPIKEQITIVNYLDSVTSKIDEAISQQQKMIDLLNERKQIIIQNAVTKGLDPNAKMKDSGVEWIGEIPEDWEVKRMRYIGDAQNGLTYSPSDIVEQSNGILVLRSSNIENGRLVFKDNVYVKKCNPKFYVKKGDIIICSRNGSASLVGKCAIVDNEIDASFGAFMMRFRSYNHNKYIYYLLTSAISHYKQLFSTSTINQLTLSIFANIKMPICSHYIQKDIADYLDDTTSKIDSSISQCNKMISLLQERKQIIINDVVTGKGKVV